VHVAAALGTRSHLHTKRFMTHVPDRWPFFLLSQDMRAVTPVPILQVTIIDDATGETIDPR
jgi:hypothetical protein